jgi:predicted DNA-binding transcriptional regulator YafY
MKSSRLLSILILLQLRKRLTADALAREFEVSVRTIYRDIDALSAAGVPVYADKGPGGGFSLLDGYRTRLTGLNTDEAQAISMIGLPGPAAALGLGAAARRAKGKLLAALTPAAAEGADRIASRFHLDATDWYRAADDAPHLPSLARAVLDERRVRLVYDSWKGEQDWIVDPLGLVLKAGIWYLVAETRDKVRTFRASEIRSVEVTQDPATRPAGFDLPRYWAESLERFERQLRPGVASLWASATGLKRLAALGRFAADAVARAEPGAANGGYSVALPLEHSDHAVLQLLGIGPEIAVLAPPELRARLAKLAGEVAARHKG